MTDDTITELQQLLESTKNYYGETEGESIFEFILSITQIKIRTKTIIFELDNLFELYNTKIFNATEDFYSTKYNAKYNGNPIKLTDVIKKVSRDQIHFIADEVTLLFYVGLYHKIENYENEILDFYNRLNETKFKTLKSIGLDIHNKKKLFTDRDRIRIICNSIKHNNLYPKKELLKFYPYLSSEQKLSLKNFNPQADVELIKDYVKYFNVLIVLKCMLSATKNLEEYFDEYADKFEEYLENFLEDENYKDENHKLTYLKKQL